MEIFKTPLSQAPSEGLMAIELENLKREVKIKEDEIKLSRDKKGRFKSVEEMKRLLMNEVILLVLGVRPDGKKVTSRNATDKFIAAYLYVNILEKRLKDSCSLFGIARATYYNKTAREMMPSEISLKNTVLEKYNALFKYFAYDCKRVIQNPITVTYKSKV